MLLPALLGRLSLVVEVRNCRMKQYVDKLTRLVNKNTRAYFTSGTSALYLFLYGAYYLLTRVHIVKVCIGIDNEDELGDEAP